MLPTLMLAAMLHTQPETTPLAAPPKVIYTQTGDQLERFQPPGITSCLTLDLPSGTVHLTLPGNLITDAAGVIHWTPEQLAAIQAAIAPAANLSQRPAADLLAATLELQLSSPAAVKPLEPKCGQCKDGHECWVDHKWNCCSATNINCTKCHVCPAKLDLLSPTLEPSDAQR